VLRLGELIAIHSVPEPTWVLSDVVGIVAATDGSDKLMAWRLDNPTHPVLNWEGDAISALAVSPDGMYLIGGTTSGRLYLWGLSSELLASHSTLAAEIRHLEFSADGTRIIAHMISRTQFNQKVLVKVFKVPGR
jgi:WD40 repeat protein